ncbi:MAG: class I SAM-dependent methyltransferase [Terriglobales bacterium]
MTERVNVDSRNQTYFIDPSTVDQYSMDGLWPVETGLIEEFFPPPPASVLDLGCGTGRTSVGLASRGYTTVAVDISAAMIARARARHPELEFRQMDATRLKFPDMSFDAVLFSFNGIDCIYPESGRIACLKEVFRVLRPGGTFVFSTHNIVGELFSGGPFSLSTYVRAMRLFADQRGSKVRGEGYFRVQEAEDIWLYARVPSVTIRQLREIGFSEPTARGHKGERKLGILGWRHVHINFATLRPA